MMKRGTHTFILVAMAAILLISPLAISQTSTEVVLIEGVDDYEGARDTSIYSENQNSNGGGQHIFSGITAQGAERRALIAFDLSAIPSGSQITAVELQLKVSRTRGNAVISSALHRLTADWGEGEADAGANEGRGAISADGDATWRDNFKGESSWDTPGGDFVASSSATADAGALNTETIFESTDALVSDVQSWVNNPDNNFGWIIISDGTAKRFYSSENGNPDNRPALRITYTTAGE